MRCLTLILSVLLFSSCSNKPEAPDVAHLKTDVTLLRFDNDFFALDTTNITASLESLQKKYPAFLDFYFSFFAPVNDIAQQQNLSPQAALRQYIGYLKPLYDSAQKRLADLNEVEEGLEENFRYLKHYFPKTPIPAVLTSVESFNPENPLEIYGTTYYHDTLVISLQMFLGRNYPVYDGAQYPDYLRRRFEPAYILPNSFRAITAELYPDSSQGASLIEQMIEKGKQWWLMKKLMPGVADSLISGYSARQTDWTEAEERNIWGTINQNENLFTIDREAIKNYMGEAPFTPTLPHDGTGGGAPGNIGPWIGWRILATYEERHPDQSVRDILRTTAKKIFEEARYKPK